MKLITILWVALCLKAAHAQNANSVEISGSYQAMAACYDTHHLEYAMIEVPGKDKFSGIRHVLDLTEEQRAKLRVGMKLKVVGQRKAATTRKMTKAQVRRHMFDHITKRKGLPLTCPGMGEIVSKIQTGKKACAKAACGHDHGELELVAVEDDAEMVEVMVPEHIEVTRIEIKP